MQHITALPIENAYLNRRPAAPRSGGGFRLGQRVTVRRGGSGSTNLPPVRIQLSFSANGVPQMICWLAQSFTDLPFERGDGIELEIEIAANQVHNNSGRGGNAFVRTGRFVLFNGFVDDVGPGQSQAGQSSTQIVASGKLGALASTTVNVSSRSSLNWQTIPAADPDRDDWTSLKRVEQVEHPLRAITQALYDAMGPRQSVSFGGTNAPFEQALSLFSHINESARDYLADMYIPPLAVDRFNADIAGDSEVGTYLSNVFNHLRNEVKFDWQRNSVLGKLLEIGSVYMFNVLETGSGSLILPWTPMGPASTYKTIYGDEYNSVNPQRQGVDAVCGVIVTIPGHTDYERPAPIAGVYARPVSHGQLVLTDGPQWMVNTEKSPDPDSDEPRAASSGMTSTDEDLAVGNRLARFTAWSYAWQRNALEVTCPFFRTDIAPFDRLRVEVARAILRQGGSSGDVGGGFIRGDDFTDRYVYGAVDSVNILIDFASGQAATTYRLAYTHSGTEQEEVDNEISTGEHPFFNANWNSVRLDQDLASFGFPTVRSILQQPGQG